MSTRERLKEIRINRGFTQKELGRFCNMSESQISQYEIGIRNPSYKTLEKIAAALSVPTDYFFYAMDAAQPLTPEELEKRMDPVWVPISDSEGYWCLCQQGRIMPPSGLGFMAKDRPDWIFYGYKPMGFNQTYEKQIECEVFNETENKGECIRKIRRKRNLTQKQLGELCGIDEANIRKYELGKQNPRYETLEKIANALSIPISCFFKK